MCFVLRHQTVSSSADMVRKSSVERVCSAGFLKLSRVRLSVSVSVRPSHHSVLRCGGRFAAVRQAAKGYQFFVGVENL